MKYYIAVLNTKTGRYELAWSNDQPATYGREEALEAMQRYFFLGHAAMLLQRPLLDVKVEFSKVQ